MIKVTLDLSTLKNELNRLQQELYETVHMNDNQRRNTVNKLVDKVRNINAQLKSIDSTTNLEIK